MKEAHRPGPGVGIPLASDDAEALKVAASLVRDAGFDPVIVGPLARAREFDVGTTVYDSNMTGPQVREALNLPRHPAQFRSLPRAPPGSYIFPPTLETLLSSTFPGKRAHSP